MYPSGELNFLAARKVALRARITAGRWEISEAFDRSVAPLGVIDLWIGRWQKISPLVKLGALPFSLILTRLFKRRLGFVGSLLGWAPMLFRLFKSSRGAFG